MSKHKKPIMLLLITLLFIYLLSGCVIGFNQDIRSTIKKELNLLKKMDESTVSQYISYEDLFPESSETEEIDSEIAKIFPLFFQDFSYRIMDITVSEDEKSATSSIRIKTIDANALAKDYMKATMKKRIASSANPTNVEYSLEDYYLLLATLLENNKYDVLEENATITLTKKENSWAIHHTSDLDNQLVGNFVTYLANPNLFTPEEIVAIHFDTIKEFDTEQLNRYLQIDSLFDGNDAYSQKLTQALTSQINEYFDYAIVSSTQNTNTAKVVTDITSCDFVKILNTYEKQLDEYLGTSQALADGTSGRLNTANKLLLNSIEANQTSAPSTITLELKNDGSSWKVQMTEDVAQAILGNIGQALSQITNDIK